MNLFSKAAHWISTGIEMFGIGVIVIGALIASILFLIEWRKEMIFNEAYRKYRERLGQAILLGLEFLVAADIIGTVAVDPTFWNVGVLAAIVAIRTFLSFALEIEIRGRLPWKESHAIHEKGFQNESRSMPLP
jgi:uncharacterized membrane protein